MTVLTTRQVGEKYGGIPEWTMRRVVDSLEPPVERFGLKRMIPVERLPEIERALRARGLYRPHEVHV